AKTSNWRSGKNFLAAQVVETLEFSLLSWILDTPGAGSEDADPLANRDRWWTAAKGGVANDRITPVRGRWGRCRPGRHDDQPQPLGRPRQGPGREDVPQGRRHHPDRPFGGRLRGSRRPLRRQTRRPLRGSENRRKPRRSPDSAEARR